MIKKDEFKVSPYKMYWFFYKNDLKRGRLLDDDLWKSAVDDDSFVCLGDNSGNYKSKIKDLYCEFNECVLSEIKKVEKHLEVLRALLNNG